LVTRKEAGMDWNDDAIARLRGLWDEGHSTAEIGRRMGVTKNAKNGALAKELLDLVAGGDGQAVLKKFNYMSPK